MFVKIVIILLLLIVLASLLAPRPSAAAGKRLPPRLRLMMQRSAIVLLAIAAVVAFLHLAGCTEGSPPFHGQEVRDAGFGRLSALVGFTDHDGRTIGSDEFRGQVTIIFFGYTHCPDICPTMLATFQEALARLGKDAEAVRALFVTLDPERDTAARLKEYLAWFGANFRGIRGDEASTRRLAQEFRIRYSRSEGSAASGYLLDHSANGFVYDRAGRLRLLLPPTPAAEELADDLRRLLAGE